jgi:putative ABC transport system permease protein
MNFLFGVLIGLSEIRAHKFRSFLTMLGIILGVASLMSMFALTAGVAKGMRENLKAIGGVEQVSVNTKEVSEKLQDLAAISPGRTMDDVAMIRDHVPLVDKISPEASVGNAAVTRGSLSMRLNIGGGTPDFLEVNTHEMATGRFLNNLDVERNNRVAVIGAAVAQQLWPELGDDPEPIGQTLYINQRPFTVIGVFTHYERDEDKRRRELGLTGAEQARRQQRGASGGGGFGGGGPGGGRRDPFWWKNTAIVIPISTLFTEFRSAQVDAKGIDQGPNYKLDKLSVRVSDMNRFNEAIAQVNAALGSTHRGIDDYGFDTREDWFDRIESSVSAQRTSGGLIAGISLLVGGIGITNIMLASIAERVREIGIRRSVGARRRDIFIQILVESVVTAVLGGILGLVAAFAVIQILIELAPAQNAPIVEWNASIISFTFALFVGIFAGLYPAWKASSLDPITALRYE